MTKKNVNGVDFVTFESKANASAETIKYSGTCMYNDCLFKFSLNKQKKSHTVYRGTLTAQDKAKGVLKKSINLDPSSPKKTVSKQLLIRSANPKDIKNYLSESVKELYINNRNFIAENRIGRVRPDNITPYIALEKYWREYINFKSTGNEETKRKEYNSMKNIISKLKDKSMYSYTTNDITSCLPTKTTPSSQFRKLEAFWQYCLEKHYCIGSNPVNVPPRSKKSNNSERKKIEKIQHLYEKQIDDIYNYIEEHFTSPFVGLALILGGGFDAKKIVDLKWQDISIISNNFVIVKNYPENRQTATKNYSRPLMPRAARLVSRLYEEVRNNFSEEELLTMPVITYSKNSTKPYNRDALIQTCRQFIIDNYLTPEQFKILSAENLNVSGAVRLLQKTYEYDLATRCNIPLDSANMKFLLGKSLGGDVTFDSYCSFTSPAGLRHLHDLLHFTDIEEAIETTDPIIIDDESIIHTLSPPSTRSSFNAYIKLTLQPGETFSIECNHGIIGHLDAEENCMP